MKPLIYQTVIVLILLLSPLNSMVNLSICYSLLYLALRKMSSLSPIFWLFLSWNILFINAFSGIIKYNFNINIFMPVLFCIILLFVFLFGYFFHKLIFSVNINSVQKKIHMSNYLKNIGDIRLEKITLLFSKFSILAGILFFIEIIFVYGGNIFAPALLRIVFSERSATILSQLSGILFFGGLFSITSFIFLRNSKYRTFYIFGILAFAVGSILSAGRQIVFQLILTSVSCFSVMRFFNVKIKLSRIHKYFFAGSIFLILGYFVFISTARSTSNLMDNRSKLEVYSDMNNCSYSQDFQSLMKVMPPYVENFFVDYIFYFSHEIILFSEWWHFNEIKLIDAKVLRFSPFLERQFDRLGIISETQEVWLNKNAKKYHKGTIIAQGWSTSNKQLLINVGYFGAFLLVFFHGFFSRHLYVSTILNPNFGLLNLSIANNIILFNTITNSALTETQVLFYILVSLYLISRNY